MGKFPSKVNEMTNVIKNGLKQNLEFKGALHLSLKEVRSGYDKLVINVNETEFGIWVDLISIFGYQDGRADHESFRVGGHILKSLTGHQDLTKWLDLCLVELGWEISLSVKEEMIVDIFSFINKNTIFVIPHETEELLKDEGFGVMTYYPWPEEVVEEVVEEEEEVEETTEELINFENFEFVGVHEKGGNKRSDEYLDKRVGSVIYTVIETDEEGIDHVIGGDVLKASRSIYGSPARVVSIYNLDDVTRTRKGADDLVERIIKASDLNIQAEIEIAEVVLKIDIEKLLDKIQEGLEWKASQSTNEPVSEYYY